MRKSEKLARIRYAQQRDNARRRKITFKITFEEWCTVWMNALGSRWLSKRGKGEGTLYCMARKGDRGAYEIGNVEIVTNSYNIQSRVTSDKTRAKMSKSQIGNKNAVGNTNMLGKRHSPEARAKMSVTRTARKIGVGNKYRLGHHHDADVRRRIAAGVRAYWRTRCQGGLDA